MNQTIQDNAAISFTTGFYRTLGYDRLRLIEEGYYPLDDTTQRYDIIIEMV